MSAAERSLHLALCDPTAPAAQRLIRELTQELALLYDDEDGSGNFKPEDVAVPGSGFVVGWLGDGAIACGAFRPLEPGVAEIKRMFVSPAHRGRGYSRRLLSELERLARLAGYSAARLETGVLQPAAISLYENSGYRRIPCYGIYAGCEWSVCFEKRL
ncbi:MAG TPA: GNAT family N-acetyltransferase [Pirellulaceae bacterium]|nr:GNAT family N-acetyltransferase [Pirellulaceae bacterium]